MSLKTRLKAQIAVTGPLTVAEYMTACLHDPRDGYYATRPAIGAGGDFITAPSVSQMFGELIGLWAAETWAALGRPARVVLAEAGPGDGALFADALRAARAVPEFLAAAEPWLVEVSAPLRMVQRARLAQARVRWTDHLSGLPTDAPLILIANEVLDCLPAHQFVRTAEGWAERVVGLDAAGELAFGLGGPADLGVAAPEGAVLEVSPAQQAFADDLATRLKAQGGAALLIDYGRAEAGFGDTLQAVKGHAKVGALEAPGEADLTVWADFPSVIAAARAAGAAVPPVLSQATFLIRLGIEQRAAALSKAQPAQAATIARQLDRLVGAGQMGELFKAVCIHSAGLTAPAFEDA